MRPHPLRLALIAALASATASAQDTPPSGMDEIVVVANREQTALRDVARSVSIVDRDRIQAATQQLALDEALAVVPGVYMQNRYNFAQDLRVSIRGFGSRAAFGIRGIRIFVDDIPETLPDGQAQVDSIDLASAERIEVLRGPSSSLYGNASGGVIAIASERAGDTPFFEGRIAGGAYDFEKFGFKTGGANDAVDYLLSASRQRLDGYRDHSRAEGDVVNGRLGWNATAKDRLELSFNYTDQPTAQDPGGITAEQAAEDPSSARDRNVEFDAGEALSQTRAGLVYRHEGESGTFMARNYYVWRDFANRLPFTGGGSVDLERFFTGGGLQYARRGMAGGRLDGTVGFDIDRQDDRRRRFDNLTGTRGDLVFDQDELVTATGVYALAGFKFSDAISMRAGLRYDEVEFDITDRFLADGDDSGRIDFSQTSPSLAFNWALGEGAAFVSYSRSFETPTTTELANPDGSGGFNAALEPQIADNVEIGYRRIHQGLRYEIALFRIDLKDELVPFEVPEFPGRTFFRNAGASTRDGIEFALAWEFAPGWRTNLAWTWSDFRFDEFVDDNGNNFDGKQLPGLPRQFATVSLNFDDGDGFYGLIEARYAGSLFADNANAVSVPSYVVADLRGGYRFTADRWAIEPYLGVNNLFDESYNNNVRINAFGGRFFEPAPPRNAYAGVVIRFE